MSHENHSDTPPLLPLMEGLLSDADRERLFAELAAHTRVLEILAKAGPRDHATPGQLSLDDAHDLLRTGAVRAIQLRYHYDGTEWTDTLLRQPGGTRLVRCRGSL